MGYLDESLGCTMYTVPMSTHITHIFFYFLVQDYIIKTNKQSNYTFEPQQLKKKN